MRSIQTAVLALAVAALAVAVASKASATLYYDLADMPAAFSGVTATDGGGNPYSEFIGSCSTGNGNCQGDQNGTGPSGMNIATQTTWLNDNTTWDPVTGGTQIAGSQSSNSYDTGVLSTSYKIWALHGDSWYLAFLFASPISQFIIADVPNDISGIFAFNPGGGGGGGVVPLPPALILFGTALVGVAVLGRRRTRGTA